MVSRPRTLKRRIKAMKEWLKEPILLEPDRDADYAYILEYRFK